MYQRYRDHHDLPFHNNLTDEPESYDRDYYVGSSHPEPWVATGQVSAVSANLQGNPPQQFQYPPEMYVKNEQNHPAHFPWSNA